MKNIKIEVVELTKAYLEKKAGDSKAVQEADGSSRSLVVLDNLTFSIPNGSFTCFVGPSGCGKSTLLRIIAGFERPTAGKVLIDGNEVQAPSKEHVFVFQEDGLFPWLTTRENIALGLKGRINNGQGSQDQEVEEYLEMVGLTGFGDHYPHELSGGMRRRAEVARALISDPDVLYMDEPFGALDFVTRLQMREEMVNVHMMFDMTILFITHDIDEALQLGDQIIVFSNRPTKIKRNIMLDIPHPRDLTKGELAQIRKEIYREMGLHVAL